jgi:HAD superfamily hydrolase (TIGR01509 family)
VATELLIFDCDGVLVDSELISMSVLLETISAQGLTIDPSEAYDRFLGKSLTTISEVLSQDYGLALPRAALDQMRLTLYGRFQRELNPIPNIAVALNAVPVARCVASSSQLERIRLALEVTQLRTMFEPNIFSASMVALGKPAPDLFLYAAHSLAIEPARCLVIEDSPAGIVAAKSAGMHAFGFAGASHARAAHLRQSLERAGAAIVFEDMRELPYLLKGHWANLGLAQ